MSDLRRSVLGVLVTGLTWGLLWGAVGTTIGLVIGAVDPDSIDPGESPYVIGALIALIGLIAGLVFGILLSVFERGRTVLDVSLIRAGLWGVLASALLGLAIEVPRYLADRDTVYATGRFAHFLVFGAVLTPIWALTARRWLASRRRSAG